MNLDAASSLPWLHPAQQRLRQASTSDRMPHSLLVQSPAGLGADSLAEWAMAFALCESASSSARACGACPSCRLLAADSHPDAHVVRLEEDTQQIKVDQVRELIEALALKSYRGGYKVGLILGAESLNLNGANAFLKTLEEPTQNTLLIMTVRPTHRLPVTIASRCLRLSLRAPPREEALAWLQSQPQACADWNPALRLAGGAPLLAMQLEAEGLAALDVEMQETLRQLSAAAIDISLVAERWAKSDPVLRVVWLENWITTRIRQGLAPKDSGQTAEPVRLPGALLKPKIRRLFDLLDAARQFRRLSVTGMNQQLALEALLLSGGAALTS
jgi:DNA polymerase-3 subunit delta'